MGGEDLYEMLGLDKTASQAEIKKAYYKLALQWHPDRNSAPEATGKFQALQRIHEVLSDPIKRQTYDRTGSLQECEDLVHGDDFQELYAAFREAMKVTEQDLDDFSVQYRGSAEERTDLLKYYQEFGGNMGRVFEWLMLSRPDLDSHRFKDTLEEAIRAGEVKRTKAYKVWAAKVSATPPPSSDPLAPPKPKAGTAAAEASDQQALVAAIRNKSSAFNGMLAALEAKYSGKNSSKGKAGSSKGKASSSKSKAGSSKSKRSSAAVSSSDDEADDSDVPEGSDQGPEPTEEEFEAARTRVMQHSKAAAAAGGGRQRKAAGSKQKSGSSQKASKRAAAPATAAGPSTEGGKKRKKALK